MSVVPNCDFPPLENGKFLSTISHAVPGQNVTFACDEGFVVNRTLVSKAKVECLKTGNLTWEPICVKSKVWLQ